MYTTDSLVDWRPQKQEARIATLQTEADELQRQLGLAAITLLLWGPSISLRDKGDAEAIVKKHIKLLHQYNEAKDATQVRPN
jgi:hypothetical protein